MDRVLRSQKKMSVLPERKKQNNLTQADYNDLENFLQIAKETKVTKAILLEQCRQYGLGRKGKKSDLVGLINNICMIFKVCRPLYLMNDHLYLMFIRIN